MYTSSINKLYRFCIAIQFLIISGCDDSGMLVSSGADSVSSIINNDYFSTGIMFFLFIMVFCIKAIFSMEKFENYRRLLRSSTSSASV